MASAEVKELLDQYRSLTFNQEKKKVICSYTQHEMPATVTAIQSYISGKKFKKAAATKTYDYDQHKPHLVPSSKKKHLHELFCKLTLRHIGKSPADVDRHVSGKRYKTALARYKKCKATGEKFVPRVGGRQKLKTSDSDSTGGGDWMDGDDHSSGDEAEDDMSDLYPAEDFKVEDSNDENSEDFDDENDNENPNEVNSIKEKTKLSVTKEEKKTKKAKEAKAAVSVSFVKTEDSDSDYDLGVMDNGTSTNVQTVVSDSGALQKKQLKDKKKKKKRKQQDEPTSSGDGLPSKKKKKMLSK